MPILSDIRVAKLLRQPVRLRQRHGAVRRHTRDRAAKQQGLPVLCGLYGADAIVSPAEGGCLQGLEA